MKMKISIKTTCGMFLITGFIAVAAMSGTTIHAGAAECSIADKKDHLLGLYIPSV